MSATKSMQPTATRSIAAANKNEMKIEGQPTTGRPADICDSERELPGTEWLARDKLKTLPMLDGALGGSFPKELLRMVLSFLEMELSSITPIHQWGVEATDMAASPDHSRVYLVQAASRFISVCDADGRLERTIVGPEADVRYSAVSVDRQTGEVYAVSSAGQPSAVHVFARGGSLLGQYQFPHVRGRIHASLVRGDLVYLSYVEDGYAHCFVFDKRKWVVLRTLEPSACHGTRDHCVFYDPVADVSLRARQVIFGKLTVVPTRMATTPHSDDDMRCQLTTEILPVADRRWLFFGTKPDNPYAVVVKSVDEHNDVRSSCRSLNALPSMIGCLVVRVGDDRLWIWCPFSNPKNKKLGLMRCYRCSGVTRFA